MTSPNGRSATTTDIILRILTNELNLEVRSADTLLLESGLLDSLGVVDLVYRLEQRFGVQISFDTLEPQDFQSVASLTRLVSSLTGGSDPTASGSST